MDSSNLTKLAKKLAKKCGGKAIALWIRNAQSREGKNPGPYWHLYGYRIEGEFTYFLDVNGRLHRDVTNQALNLLVGTTHYLAK